ncbi:TMC domain [Nesidiocoris tenuis]|uniref:TMC domain n=1 Tax=Nesidiocoris tenuis TaxID=355587 RepID=A0ABN7ABA3_9HEMI|nr:TMC domain [Nesidiocoris tenuis]
MVHRQGTGTNLPLVQMIRNLKDKAENSSFSLNPFAERAAWSPGTEMSGGERKKRTPRGTGWEEAGGEFYQESYPGAELDLEALPRDPHYFATLLPSKQNRAATTRKPSKVDNKATYRRRTSTRQRNTNTMGQNTIPNDIQVAMMPDLSENLANEETTWEEMMLIKAMPVTMAQKKEIKAKLLSADTFRMQGMRRLKWRRRKLWEYLKVRWKEFHTRIELWRSSFQKMDGRFGPAITSFFTFIKWLMLLNIVVALIISSFIILPTAVMEEREEECLPTNQTSTSIPCCSQLYMEHNSSLAAPSAVFEVLQGSGWLDRTLLFYGYYTYTPLINGSIYYDLPVAYVFTFMSVFLLCFFTILKSGSVGFKERLIESEGQYYKFCSLVFSGWDFCLHSDKGTSAKHKALFLEMKEHIEQERREDDKKNRSRDECCRTLLTRLSMKILVKLIFAAASSLIYFTIQFAYTELQTDDYTDEYRLLLEYMPALSIVGVNLVVPNILHYLVTLEGYSPLNTQRMVLLRNLLLRFSTICVLLVSIHSLVGCSIGPNDACVSHSCRTPLCWETFAAQQILKIVVVDFLAQIGITFFINFPRMLLARHVRCKLTKVMCLQEFDIFKHLVDVVYIQFLVWLSSFIMPLMPALGALLLFVLFYVKKFACMVNSMPSSTTLYRVRKSTSLYLLVLLGTFFAAMGPVIFAAVTLEPSRSCGPLRGQRTYASLVESTYRSFPTWIQNGATIITSSTVAFPTLVFLWLLFYYYYILTRENRQMVIVLKKQLVLEGHDKQFLLNRLSAFIKQHQERHKPARSIDPPIANSA